MHVLFRCPSKAEEEADRDSGLSREVAGLLGKAIEEGFAELDEDEQKGRQQRDKISAKFIL